MSNSFEKRFWSKVERSSKSSCWEWTAGKFTFGYGAISRGGKVLHAHRVAFELENGEIPEGACVLHRCDNPSCCNPSHLRLGSQEDNVADRVSRGRSATGDQNGSRKFPERLTAGDEHWTRRSPEQVRRGETHPEATIGDWQVIGIMARWLQGTTKAQIAREFEVSWLVVDRIVTGKTWKHLFADE